jgi:hypothetical protein
MVGGVDAPLFVPRKCDHCDGFEGLHAVLSALLLIDMAVVTLFSHA